MGLILSIFKHGGTTASNGGFSARHDEVTCVNIVGPFEPTEQRPPVMLMPGNVRGTAKVVPAIETPDGGFVAASGGDFYAKGAVGPMMGGTYVGTPDSRFSEAVEVIVGARFYGAVPFHDRFESQSKL